MNESRQGETGSSSLQTARVLPCPVSSPQEPEAFIVNITFIQASQSESERATKTGDKSRKAKPSESQEQQQPTGTAMKPNYYSTAARCLHSRVLAAMVLLLALAIAPKSSAAPRQPGPPIPEAHLYQERFDEPYNFPADQIDSSMFVPSWSGYALNRQAGAAITPWTVPMVAVDGSWQVPRQAGAIRFWFMPSFSSSSLGGTGPGDPATLLTLVSSNVNASLTWWSLIASADGNAIQLQCPASNSDAPCLTGPVTFSPGGGVS